MNKLFLILLTMTCSFSAFADIPRPPYLKPFTEVLITGEDATELSKALDVAIIQGHSRDRATCSYKVYRSSSGKTQIVCQFWTGEGSPIDLCSIKKSTGVSPLPLFNPREGL